MGNVESASKTIDKVHSRLCFHEAEEKTPIADIILSDCDIKISITPPWSNVTSPSLK